MHDDGGWLLGSDLVTMACSLQLLWDILILVSKINNWKTAA